MKRLFEKYYLPALLLFTIGVFSKAFVAGYVNWDDNIIIGDNLYIKGPLTDALSVFFTRVYFSDYMPLTMLTFWVDTHLFGASPVAQHVIGLLFHLVNVGLLFWLLNIWGVTPRLTRMIVFLFAIHPVQTETVLWITARNGILATLFSLLAIIFYEKQYDGEHSRRNQILAAVFFMMGTLSKSVALLLPPLFVLLSMLRHGESLKGAMKKNSVALVLAFIFLVVRTIAYSVNLQELGDATWDFERIFLLPLSMLNVMTLYWKLIVWPVDLSVIYHRFEPDPLAVARALFFIFSSYALIKFWPKEKRNQLYIWIALILLFLLPVLQILPRINYYNDRYLYFPIIGFAAILLTYLNKYLPEGVVWLILLVFPVLTYQRSKAWVSDLSLWTDTVLTTPDSALAHNNLGIAYHLRKDLSDAVREYKATVLFPPEQGANQLAYNNLGVIYSDKRSGALYNPADAIQMFNSSISVAPRISETFDARYNIGLTLAEIGRPDEAKSVLQLLMKDLESSPDKRHLLMIRRSEDLLEKIEKMKKQE